MISVKEVGIIHNILIDNFGGSSVAVNHPFIDGNKRTAYTLMRLILMENGIDIAASQDEKYKFVISVSTGDFRFDDIKAWIQANLKK